MSGVGADAPVATPSRDSVVHLVEAQLHTWETGDAAVFLGTLHGGVVYAYPGKRLDRAGAQQMFQAWTNDSRDTKVRIHRLLVDGAHFAVEYTFASTNRATGKRTAAGTVATGEVRDGKLIVWKEYLDGRVSRAQAKGELPVQEEAEPFPWPDTPESRKP